MNDYHDREKIDLLMAFATHIGATKVKRLSPESVCVEDKLADFCQNPKCPSWGQSMSCPPHVSGPASLRKLLQSCRHAIVIQIEIQSSSPHGDGRREVMRLLNEITAEIETEAIRLGFIKSAGFAGGSCKTSFCHDKLHCRVIDEQGECRHPKHARPSMSGYGVNVGELMKSAGWSANIFSLNDDGEEGQLSWVAGLVLLQ